MTLVDVSGEDEQVGSVMATAPPLVQYAFDETKDETVRRAGGSSAGTPAKSTDLGSSITNAVARQNTTAIKVLIRIVISRRNHRWLPTALKEE